KPWLKIPLYGASPFTATDVISEELNQPRYWSDPSRYISAGKAKSSLVFNTPACVEPESNQTSIISVSLRNSPWPHFAQLVPSGTRSFSSRANHTSEPCSSNKFATCSIVASF